MEHSHWGMLWRDFETEAPRLSHSARSVIERFGFVYLGTVRRDGAPRISPVEAHIVDGHLMLVMVAVSQKLRDLARDPRVNLQSPVVDAEHPGVELKLRARIMEVDGGQRAATADAVDAASGWRPQPSLRFLSLDVEAVAMLGWDEGEMVLTRWNRRDGERPAARFRLDVDASTF